MQGGVTTFRMWWLPAVSGAPGTTTGSSYRESAYHAPRPRDDMNIPDWYTLVLLAAAAYRVFRLLSEDTILDGPRAWVLGYRGWKEGRPLPDSYRTKAAEFVSCPWCLGFYIALLIYLFWLWQPGWTTTISVPLAISCFVGMLEKHLSD